MHSRLDYRALIWLAGAGVSFGGGLFACGEGKVTEMLADSSSVEMPDAFVGGAEDSGARTDSGVRTLDAGVDAGNCAQQVPSPLSEPQANVRLVLDGELAPFLATGSGEPLYMHAGDIAASGKTACLGECASRWRPFDATPVVADCGLNAREFGRFHRDDGAFQTTYKGHPLYLRADGAGAKDVDGDEGRWFLAKDYLVFLSSRPALVPMGSAELGDPFLTDGFGRALYICLEDAPATADADPVSSCTGSCTEEFPFWSTIHTLRTTRLPSLIAPQDFAAFEREDGGVQLTFRGWPLYQFAREDDVQGHNVAEWRLVGPLTVSLSK